MTNRHMVKSSLAAKPSGLPRHEPNGTPLPPMPAPEGSRMPTTREEPIDSPQPNASAERDAPLSGEAGLGAARDA